MILIATDEAGYGPKLGPLVIAATAWRLPGNDLSPSEIDAFFAPMRFAAMIGDVTVKVDDSKVVYKPGAGLAGLHAVVSASHHWCGREAATLPQTLAEIAADDLAAIAETPWLGKLSAEPLIDRKETDASVARWRSTGLELGDVQVRIITAKTFNQACTGTANKADLLSESTIGLVAALVRTRAGDERQVTVYCDRHGGRRYYAGVLMHCFPDATMQVIEEKKSRSAYRLTFDGKRIDIAFTVKGDSFTPVALSSMHAKYLRERMVESFNAFFASKHRGDGPLRPTAGYPVDADRFLIDIADVIRREKIDLNSLVRQR